MALTTIKYGELASSEVVNNNFKYLDDKISNLNETVTSNKAGMNSNIASINSSITTINENMTKNVEKLEESINEAKSFFSESGLFVNTYINGASWYKEYFSDSEKKTRVWLEQGGIFRSINSEITVNLNLEFSDNKYSLVCSGNNSSAEKHILDANIYNKETAYFKGFPVVSFNGGFATSNDDFYTWLAKGYANTSALNNQFNFSNYLYFKVGNTTVGAETIDVGHLIVEVNNKANISGDNVNFNNLSETAKENIQNCLIPDLDNPITVSNGMTIEHNGILYFRTGTLGACAIFINGVAVYHVNVASGTTADGGSLLLFKGDVLTFNNLDSNSITKFYYFK